jgi:ParB family chromosome partitioning protein
MTLTINPTPAHEAGTAELADRPEAVEPVTVAPSGDWATGGEIFLQLDPRILVPDPANVRDTVANLRGLKASIKALGVLQPLVIKRNDDGDPQIIAGHRRQQAAIAAGVELAPCVRIDLAGADVVLAALGENLQREDLSELEVANGYQQAFDLGASPTRIARLTGAKADDVKKALAVTASTAAVEAMTTAAVTLDQAAAIAGFEDDPDAQAELLGSIGDHWGFKHTLSRLTSARERKAKADATTEALRAAGFVVIDDPRFTDDPKPYPNAAELYELSASEKDYEAIDPEAHTDCPGHAAVINRHDPEKADYWCLDPAVHGHHNRFASASSPGGKAKGQQTEAQREEASVQRKRVIKYNQAWRDAEPVRREFVRLLLTKKRPPKGCLRFVTDEVMRRPHRLGDGSDMMLGELTGRDGTGWGRNLGLELVNKATDVTLPLVLFAQVASAIEAKMSVDTWREGGNYEGEKDAAARYLQYLATTGYKLSEVEQLVVDNATTEADDDEAEAEGDEDPEPGADPDEAGDEDPVAAELAEVEDHPVTAVTAEPKPKRKRTRRPKLTVINGDVDSPEDTPPAGIDGDSA